MAKDYDSCKDTQADVPNVACSVDGNSVFNYENYDATYKFSGAPAQDGYQLTLNYSNYPNSPWPPDPSIGYTYTITVTAQGGGGANDCSKSNNTCTTVTKSITPSASAQNVTFNLGTLPRNPKITISGYNNHGIPFNGNPDAYDPNFEINTLTLNVPGTSPSIYLRR